jgi:hypothetical protein
MNQSTENAIQSGICKLCLQFKPLRNSHMMAKGLYRLCRPPGYDPVGFSEAEIGPTTGRTKAYLLCDDCEQILNKEGEQWVISKLAKYNGKFVLYDLLTKQAPAFQENGITVYATATNPEIDRERLSHFGLGFFWKASVHPWGREHAESLIDLGAGSEGLRKYLLGQGEFPGNMALVAQVIPKPVKIIGFTEPIGLWKTRPNASTKR